MKHKFSDISSRVGDKNRKQKERGWSFIAASDERACKNMMILKKSQK